MSQEGHTSPTVGDPPAYPMTPSFTKTENSPNGTTTTTTVTTLTTTTTPLAPELNQGQSMETLINSIDNSNNILSLILRGMLTKMSDQQAELTRERAARLELEDKILKGGLGSANASSKDLNDKIEQTTCKILHLVKGVNGTMKSRLDNLEKQIGNLVFNLQGFEMEMHSQTEAQRDAEKAFEETLNRRIAEIEKHEKEFERRVLLGEQRKEDPLHAENEKQVAPDDVVHKQEVAKQSNSDAISEHGVDAMNADAPNTDTIGSDAKKAEADVWTPTNSISSENRLEAKEEEKFDSKTEVDGEQTFETVTSTKQLAQQGRAHDQQSTSKENSQRKENPRPNDTRKATQSEQAVPSQESTQVPRSADTVAASKNTTSDLKPSGWSKVKDAAGYIKPQAADIKKYREFFRLFDADKSGKLEVNEILALMKALGLVEMSQKEVIKMMNESDIDHSGEIDEKEFIAMMTQGSWAHKFRNAKLNFTGQRVSDPKRSIGSRVQEIEQFMHTARAQFRSNDRIVTDLNIALEKLKRTENSLEAADNLRQKHEEEILAAKLQLQEQEDIIAQLKIALEFKADKTALDELLKGNKTWEANIMQQIQIEVLKELTKLLTTKEEKTVVADALQRVQNLENFKRSKVDKVIGKTLPEMAKQLSDLRETVKKAISETLEERLKIVVERPELETACSELNTTIGKKSDLEFVESMFQQLRMRTESLYNELEILQEAEHARKARAKEREEAGQEALLAVKKVHSRVLHLTQNIEDDFKKLSEEMLTKADAGKVHDILVRLDDLAPVSKESVDKIRAQLSHKASKNDVDRLASIAARLHDTVRELDQAHRHGMIGAGLDEATATRHVPRCLTCNRAVPGGITKGNSALADTPSSTELIAAMHRRNRAEQHFQHLANMQSQEDDRNSLISVKHQGSFRNQRRPATANGSRLYDINSSGDSIYVMKASTITNSQYSKSLETHAQGKKLVPLELIRRGGRPRAIKSAGSRGRISSTLARPNCYPRKRQRSWGGAVRGLSPNASLVKAYGREKVDMSMPSVGAEHSLLGSSTLSPDLLDYGGSGLIDAGGSAEPEGPVLMDNAQLGSLSAEAGLSGPFSPIKPMKTFVKGCDGKLYQSGSV